MQEEQDRFDSKSNFPSKITTMGLQSQKNKSDICKYADF